MTYSHHHENHDDESAVQLGERFLKHARRPANLGRLNHNDCCARGVGTCGDAVEVFLRVENQRITDIKYIPDGCSYTIACASAMSTLAKGRQLTEALRLTPDALIEVLGGLPEDHRHCAALAINTLGEAIEDYYRKCWGKG